MAVWLPLQAVAVPLLAGCCPDRESAAAADETPCHEHPGAVISAAAAHDEAAASSEHEGGVPDNPSHVCCPHYAGAPVHRFDVAASPTRFAPPLLVVSARSHVPEQPQRPPRS
jgi:hypothetical protein